MASPAFTFFIPGSGSAPSYPFFVPGTTQGFSGSPATTTTLGTVLIDTTPASPSSPTAVGVNSPLVTGITSSQFGPALAQMFILGSCVTANGTHAGGGTLTFTLTDLNGNALTQAFSFGLYLGNPPSGTLTFSATTGDAQPFGGQVPGTLVALLKTNASGTCVVVVTSTVAESELDFGTGGLVSFDPPMQPPSFFSGGFAGSITLT